MIEPYSEISNEIIHIYFLIRLESLELGNDVYISRSSA